MFATLPPYHGDPIFGLVEEFRRDPRPKKVNLAVGVYFNDEGKIPILPSVLAAERRYIANRGSLGYLQIEGDSAFRTLVRDLLLGAAPDLSVRATVVQTVGGSGALKVGADLLAKLAPNRTIWVSDPTWDNHIGIFSGSGFTVRSYTYYDSATRSLDFHGMLQSFEAMSHSEIVLMSPCCHNPSGIDPTREQWNSLLDVIQSRGLLPFIDFAYQGFADDIRSDAWVISELVARKVDFMVASSFSKNFSIYGERCGALSVICARPADAANVLGQLQLCIRQNYSSPPSHGAALVSGVLSDPDLTNQWLLDLATMRDRIQHVRKRFYAALERRMPGLDCRYLLRQTGLFAYTGLTQSQVEVLRRQFGVYALHTGRVCIAGLNSANLEYAADAFATVLADNEEV